MTEFGNHSHSIVFFDKEAIFTDNRKYRLMLRRIWDNRKPTAACIGLNPSTANEDDDDTTITNLCKLLDTMGYGSLVMLNLFSLVSTKPAALRSHPNPNKGNDEAIDYWTRGADVIFCWGSFTVAQYRAKQIIKKFPNGLCFGKTAKGEPMHPLAVTIWQKSKCKLQLYANGK